MLIDTGSVRILTDPGMFSTTQNEARDVDVILITHEHADHLHVDSVKEILKHNPKAIVVTNTAVGNILEKEGIVNNNMLRKVGDGEKTDVNGVVLEGFGTKHAEIYEQLGQVENTGYFIDNKLFYPGDAFYDPKRPVDILALPVAGPWMKIGEAIRYALALKPRTAFPVHDAVLANPGMSGMWFTKIFSEQGIAYVQLNASETKEF